MIIDCAELRWGVKFQFDNFAQIWTLDLPDMLDLMFLALFFYLEYLKN